MRAFETPTLTFVCGGYDRIEALRSGEVSIPGVHLKFEVVDNPRQIFDAFMGKKDYDAGELSLSEFISTFVAAKEAGRKHDLVAIPVFPSRAFRHGFIAVNNRQISRPKDLEGKRIGVPLYTMTAAIWIRGVLSQFEGVDLSQVQWIQGSMNKPGPHGHPSSLPPPSSVNIAQNNDEQRSLSQLLADGEISATLGAHLPECLGKVQHISRLYPDHKQAEKDFYRQHGVFPIMHCVVIRRSFVDSDPTLPARLYEALDKSKAIALCKVKFLGSLRYMLPWLPDHLDEIADVFADRQGDPWQYGLDENRQTLQLLVDIMFDQGLINQKPTLEELFSI